MGKDSFLRLISKRMHTIWIYQFKSSVSNYFLY